MRRAWILLIFIVILANSCLPYRNIGNPNIKAKAKEFIVYHDFIITNYENNLTIREQSTQLIPGKIKTIGAKPEKFNNPVEITFLDRNNRRLGSTFIEHPLISVYEYPELNGEMGKSTQMIDSSVFFIRYNAFDDLSFIKLQTQSSCPIPINEKIKLKK